jgi:hypothetical protein
MSRNTIACTGKVKYVVAIPSYKRAGILAKKTLPTLQRCGIPSRLVHIFVASKEEEQAYREALPRDMYHKLVVGRPGLARQRSFIMQYFREDTPLLMVDDDIDYFLLLTREEGKERKDKSSHKDPPLEPWIQRGFALCRREGARLFGMYPLANERYMNRKIVVGKVPICGAAFGTFADPDPRWLVRYDEHEDFERSLIHFRHVGRVVRFNNIGYHTSYFAQGGIEATTKDRTADSLIRAQTLHDKYPEFVSGIHYKDKLRVYNPKFRLDPERYMLHPDTCARLDDSRVTRLAATQKSG